MSVVLYIAVVQRGLFHLVDILGQEPLLTTILPGKHFPRFDELRVIVAMGGVGKSLLFRLMMVDPRFSYADQRIARPLVDGKFGILTADEPLVLALVATMLARESLDCHAAQWPKNQSHPKRGLSMPKESSS